MLVPLPLSPDGDPFVFPPPAFGSFATGLPLLLRVVPLPFDRLPLEPLPLEPLPFDRLVPDPVRLTLPPPP